MRRLPVSLLAALLVASCRRTEVGPDARGGPKAKVASAPRSDPATARGAELLARGLALLENESTVEAEKLFREFAAAVPKEPAGPANLAVALLRQGRAEEALAEADRALALAPERADLASIRADVLTALGRVADAMAVLDEALRRAPDEPRLAFQLHLAANAASNVEGDRHALQALVRLRPENVAVLLAAGARALGDANPVEATRAYVRLRELSWQLGEDAKKHLAATLDALERRDLAAAEAPARRLANVIAPTELGRGARAELSLGLNGVPVERLAGAASPTAFGGPVEVVFAASTFSSSPTAPDGLVAADLDEDGKADLVRIVAWPSEWEVFLSSRGLAPFAMKKLPRGLAALRAADLDNDGHLDLFASGPPGAWVFRGDGKGALVDATERFGLVGARGEIPVLFDADLEGDLDVALFGADGARLFRNTLEGALQPLPPAVFPKGLALGGATAALASDLDRDGDPDLAVLFADRLVLLENRRQSSFVDASRRLGAGAAFGGNVLRSADLDGDGRPELVVAGGPPTPLRILRSTPLGFEPLAAGLESAAGTNALRALVTADLDNDGRLDLVAEGDGPLTVFWNRSSPSGVVFERAAVAGAPAGATSLGATDLDGDGDLDLVAGGSFGLVRLENRGGNANRWMDVRLRGLSTGSGKNNLDGLGATVEVRAGGAYQFREVTDRVTHLGLGRFEKADSLRVVWTNGVPQNRFDVGARQLVVEAQLLKGSCPFLYAKSGGDWRFVTDLLWGAPLGLPVAEGVFASSDPTELVKVEAAQAEGGAYELAITEELWEAAFFDLTRLWVVDHPTPVEVASALKVIPGRATPEAVLGSLGVTPVAAAWDGNGRNVTARVEKRDGVYADGYAASAYQGVARAPWTFQFELGRAPDGPFRLFLDGWIFPADASLNVAVAQRKDLPYLPPRLDVETPSGWMTLVPEMGFPAGKTKTMVVDVPAPPPGARRFAIVTSLWLGWDRVAWSSAPADDEVRVVARLAPSSATLRYRGFSEIVRRAPNAPHDVDYAKVRRESPWLPFPGRYTKYGDVKELLVEADDRLVILAPGDELALAFDTRGLPPVPPGYARTVFLESHGWDKDADRNTFAAATMEPLPFRAMSGYPYGPGESYPETPLLTRYRREWLTREVGLERAGRDPSLATK